MRQLADSRDVEVRGEGGKVRQDFDAGVLENLTTPPGKLGSMQE